MCFSSIIYTSVIHQDSIFYTEAIMDRIDVVGVGIADEAVARAERTVHFSGKIEIIPAIADMFAAELISSRHKAVRCPPGESKNDVHSERQVAAKPRT